MAWMERRRLGILLDGVGLAAGLALEPSQALALLEDRADREPADRAVSAALSALLERLAVEGSAPAGELVRWDELTVGWKLERKGRTALVRALRPLYRAHPAARRWLLREGRALARVTELEVDDSGPELVLTLPGQPLSARWGDAVVRPLLTGLAALARWEREGLGLPWLLPEEIRVVEERVVIACAWPQGRGISAALASLASALVDPADDTALAATVRAFGTHPPETVADAARLVRSALAEHLAARRHGLAARWRESWHRSQETRLREVVGRLALAGTPPVGKGAVGVDLDGRITIVEADKLGIRWGPERGVEIVFDWEGGFRPPTARRLLRARAISPPNPSLDARVGGDAAATDAICRWVAAGLRLRTVQMLLERDRT
jgi:hypothetical protein